MASTRNRLTALSVVVAVAIWVSIAASAQESWQTTLRDDLEVAREQARIPGLAAAILVQGELVWVEGLGWADLERETSMTPDSILNIGSVSKLFTATAASLLYQEGRLDLDADINDYLPFHVRHPAAPEAAITARQLLTHTAGIADAAAYGASYACGDPEVSLEDWLQSYLTPGGTDFTTESFLDTAPGAAFGYSNVGYGLLGLVVERISGRPFSEFTRDRILEPLGMQSSGWHLSDIEIENHATPYRLHSADLDLEPEDRALLPEGVFEEGAFVPYCLYSFYNYPDGLMRTTIQELAAFVMATLPGDSGRDRLLHADTRAEVFSDQLGERLPTDGRIQGLGWRRIEIASLGSLWSHGGADPGIRAHVLHRAADGVTVIMLANRLVVDEVRPIVNRLFEEGARLASEGTR